MCQRPDRNRRGGAFAHRGGGPLGSMRAVGVAGVVAASLVLAFATSANAQRMTRGGGVILASVQLQEVLLPGELQYTLFAKIFTFDRNLHRRSEGEFVIGVVYQDGFPTSRAVARELREAFAASDIQSVEGLPVRMVMIPLEETRDLASRLREEGADLAYVAPLRAVGLESILGAARMADAITITAVPDYVSRGVAVGLGVEGGTPQILINLASARNEGADFEANLLSLAEVLQ